MRGTTLCRGPHHTHVEKQVETLHHFVEPFNVFLMNLVMGVYYVYNDFSPLENVLWKSLDPLRQIFKKNILRYFKAYSKNIPKIFFKTYFKAYYMKLLE